jgi:hypothetical protein
MKLKDWSQTSCRIDVTLTVALCRAVEFLRDREARTAASSSLAWVIRADLAGATGLQLKVIFQAHAADQIQLHFHKIDVLFFVLEDARE